MNTLEAFSIESPFGKVDECAKFTIDDIATYFLLSNIATIGQKYTLSFWVKGDTTCNLSVAGDSCNVTAEWQKRVITFTASNESIAMLFETVGTYYIYHPKLEIGNKATDWSPAPEDTDESIEDAKSEASDAVGKTNGRIDEVKALIEILENSISMLVTDENGESLMTQTKDGWTFCMQETNKAVSDIREALDGLQTLTGSTKDTVGLLDEAVKNNSKTLEYVNISTYNDQPCIELGESDSSFKLLITNTDIRFWNGSDFSTRVNTDGLETDNIKVGGEIVQGGYVMMNTSDGGWGLLWKGVSS